MSPFLIDLVIAVLVYFLFNAVIDTFVNDPNANKMFKLILLIACVIFALFGTLLPFAR